VAGNGGNGLSSSYSGTSITYAGGGGGGADTGAGMTAGTGGTGGGGAGSWKTPVSGTANLGGGGGAVWNPNTTAGAGGSGVVIIRYPDSKDDLTTIAAGLTYTKTTSGGFKIYRFTAGTGTVTV
jgi:hypothetical protein